MPTNTDPQKIEHLLTRGVDTIYPSREMLEERLKKGEKLRIYVGFDPTAPFLHIGHALQLKKLREFQDLGHEVIWLIGSFTGMIGDPTDKGSARQQLTKKQVLENAATYKKQGSKIVSFSGKGGVKIKFNDKWLSKMSFADVVELASHFTVQQMLERDMFENRMFEKKYVGSVRCWNCETEFVPKSDILFVAIDKQALDEHTGKMYFDSFAYEACPECGKTFDECPNKVAEGHRIVDIKKFEKIVSSHSKPIYLHEFMYPLMQGYDSVAMDVDVEIGGSDQTFNMLAGRTLMKAMKGKEKIVLTLKLLTNDEGKKMSKSEGGFIALTDSPEDMYGKVMAMDDSMIIPYFELVTDLSMDDINGKKLAMEQGVNPRDVKAELAHMVVAQFHDEKLANAAAEHFSTVFQKGELPEDIETFAVPEVMNVVDVLVESGLVSSKSEARRMIEQKAVKLDGTPVTSVDMMIEGTQDGLVLQKGKRHFVRLIK